MNTTETKTDDRFTNQNPFLVTAEKLIMFRRGRIFQCSLCGHKFKVGDTARWVYANGTPGLQCGNFFVCVDCDATNEVILSRAKSSIDTALKLGKQWGLI